MSSVRMKIVAGYLRLTQKPKMNTAARARKAIERDKTSATPPSGLIERHTVKSRRVEGFVVHSITSGARTSQRAVIYLHGGAYISEITPQHWAIISAMVDAGLRVDVPIYGLASKYSYRDAYPFIAEVYRSLSSELGVESISIVGDSAGAGLALGFVQTLGIDERERLRRLVLISPWLDLTLGNPLTAALRRRDPWLSRIGLLEAGKSWAAGDDVVQPQLSPINGPLDHLPATDVYIGTRDLFHPDVMLLQSKAAAAGSDLQVIESPGAVHVYPLVPAPEGRKASASIVNSVS